MYTNGTIDTFAGNGGIGYSGDGGPATNATLSYPYSVAVSPSGLVYIADTDNNRVRVVYTNGSIDTFAGTGSPGNSGNSGPATSAAIGYISSIAVSSSGIVYIADYASSIVRAIYLNGTIDVIAGTGTS